jgi:hypothetical protein
MSKSAPDAPPLPDDRSRGVRPAVAASATVAGIVFVVFGRHGAIDYDGLWNLFIARQTDIGAFVREIAHNAHPPLYDTVLKAVLSLGGSPLLDRALSIAAAVVSTLLIALILARCCRHASLAPLGALAFALSRATIVIALAVRPYALLTVFLLASFDGLLEATTADPDRSRRGLVTFGVGAGLALLTHYSAAIYLASCAVALAILSVWQPTFGHEMLARMKANRRTAGLVAIALAGLGLLLFTVHARHRYIRLSHLPAFYFDPAGHENPLAFLARAFGGFFFVFQPFPRLRVPLLVALAVASAVVFGVGLARASRRDGERASVLARTLTAVMIAAVAAGSILGVYPFGATLRHDYFIFPFLIFSLFMTIDDLVDLFPGDRARVVLAAVALAVGAKSFLTVLAYPREQRPSAFSAAVDTYRARFDPRTPVFTDQYNTILLFSEDTRRPVAYLGTCGSSIEMFRLGNGPAAVPFARDDRTWNWKIDQPGLYADLEAYRKCLGRNHVDLFLFRMAPRSEPDLSRARESVQTLASAAGLTVRNLWLDARSCFADLAAR